MTSGIPFKSGGFYGKPVEVFDTFPPVGKAQMVRNDRTPDIEVDTETYQVTVAGRPAVVPAATEVPMSQLYYIV